ncbi:MAG: hypothetical protein IAB19_02335 [Proteobacteria bacterium]|uniref:site-specific DNA-methyltransferase (cytosine-N(4)-specific) n=1 Tax=Candidatus Avisuccinivibrio stercorigallinarum TaxID=2840704 RepID=A0A9D9DBR2_9GAMM|nr:hypothetical protein [Candidatus Avisuccinivibrio stercorigallinarum]
MQQNIAQNATLTFKYNQELGRHGWLRLTPAYSVRLVEQLLQELDYKPRCVLDPFSGSGTTALVCANQGINSFAFDINPFLVWLGNVKLCQYSSETRAAFVHIAAELAGDLQRCQPAALPPIFNLDRWWGRAQADFLARLKGAIWELRSTCDGEVVQLLQIAFCRMVIELSNAAFNHVSTSFKNTTGAANAADAADAADAVSTAIAEEAFDPKAAREQFLQSCSMVSEGAAICPQAQAQVLLRDARDAPAQFTNQFDTIITSPPYPNRISYIRELRPYMFWMDMLKSAGQAGELDWQAIGGTWGRATSRLGSWHSAGTLPQYICALADKIAKADHKSARLMANYVLKYFEDMREHLHSAFAGLCRGGRVFYIVGNSSFYGVLVPTDQIYADLLQDAGFVDVDCTVVRKRNCNKKLFEYAVSARKP